MKDKLLFNKKGIAPIALVVAIFLGIVFLIFFSGGGLGLVYDITVFLKKIPGFVWAALGLVILIRLIGGRRR